MVYRMLPSTQAPGRRSWSSGPAAAAVACVLAGCNALWGIDGLAYDRPEATTGGGPGGAGGAGATGGAAGASSGGGGEAGSRVEDFAYRRRLAMVGSSAELPFGLSLATTIDHAAMVADGKASATGNDVRVFWHGVDPPREIPRVIDPDSAWQDPATAIWFATQAQSSSEPPSGGYYLYYGHEQAGAPPADPASIFVYWAPFDEASLAGWTLAELGSASSTIAATGGLLRMTTASGDIWGTDDDCAFLYRMQSGDFIAEAAIDGAGGDNGQYARQGGVMVRQSVAADSRHQTLAPIATTHVRSFLRRLDDGATTDSTNETSNAGFPERIRLTRQGDQIAAEYAKPGGAWSQVGSPAVFTTSLVDPVLVGIPHSNSGGTDAWVEVDWFRIRKAVSPMPAVTLGPEEAGPF